MLRVETVAWIVNKFMNKSSLSGKVNINFSGSVITLKVTNTDSIRKVQNSTMVITSYIICSDFLLALFIYLIIPLNYHLNKRVHILSIAFKRNKVKFV